MKYLKNFNENQSDILYEEISDIDYSNRINKYIAERYDVNIFSYVMNYLNAKIKNAKIE